MAMWILPLHDDQVDFIKAHLDLLDEVALLRAMPMSMMICNASHGAFLVGFTA